MPENLKPKDEQIGHEALSELAKNIAEELNKRGIGIKEAGPVFKDPDFAKSFIEQVGKKALEDVSKAFETAEGKEIGIVNEIKIGFPEAMPEAEVAAVDAAASFSNKRIMLNKQYYDALVKEIFEDFQVGDDVAIKVLQSLASSDGNILLAETLPDKVLSKYSIGEKLEDRIEALAIYVYTRLVHESVHAIQDSHGAKEKEDNMIFIEGSASFVELYFANALINNGNEKIAKAIEEDLKPRATEIEQLASFYGWKSLFTIRVSGEWVISPVSPYDLGLYVFAKIYQASGSFAETLKFMVSLLEKGEISDYDLYKEFEKLRAQLSNAADIMPLQRE
ncbi:MAG: hypothetical protein ACP5GD_03050 [Candidatus Micrarchaeia archaeon]